MCGKRLRILEHLQKTLREGLVFLRAAQPGPCSASMATALPSFPELLCLHFIPSSLVGCSSLALRLRLLPRATLVNVVP